MILPALKSACAQRSCSADTAESEIWRCGEKSEAPTFSRDDGPISYRPSMLVGGRKGGPWMMDKERDRNMRLQFTLWGPLALALLGERSPVGSHQISLGG